MTGPNVPNWLRQQLKIMPYHQFIELALFLERPDHVEQIDAVFGEILASDVEMMGEEEIGDESARIWSEAHKNLGF